MTLKSDFKNRFMAYNVAPDDGGVPSGGAGGTGEGAVDAPVFSIPDEYKDAAWAKDIDSTDALFKQHANAQTLIGKKTIGIPGADSPAEEWDSFYAKVRPETIAEYEFPEISLSPDREHLSDFIKQNEDPVFNEKLRGVMHETGLTKHQAGQLYQKFNELLIDHNSEAFAEQEKALSEQAAAREAASEARDKAFKAAFDTNFDTPKDADAAVELVMKTLEAEAPDALKGVIFDPEIAGKVPPEYLAAIAASVNTILRGSRSEDAPVVGGYSAGETVESLRERRKELYANPLYFAQTGATRNDPARTKLLSQIESINKRIAALGS